MPVRIVVDVETRRVRAEVAGTSTLEEMTSAIDAALLSPAFRTGFHILSDHTKVETPITPDQLQGLVAHLMRHAERLRESRWAVVTRMPASFGMMRMLEVHTQEVPLAMRVFTSRDEAEAWLSRRPADDSGETESERGGGKSSWTR